MADGPSEVDALRQELAEVRDQLAALRRTVDAARLTFEPTMRRQLRCPVCDGRRIAHALHVLDRGDGDTRESLALYQPSWWDSDVVGEVEAFACCSCGYLEWYVKNPAALVEHPKYMRILDGEPPAGAGPYR